jgi:hypothetical protein
MREMHSWILFTFYFSRFTLPHSPLAKLSA